MLIDNLRDHRFSWLSDPGYEKFGRINSGAYGRIASVQRDAELDVFPKLTLERSRFHTAFYCLHEPGPKH
jgi:hypothetical protein